MNHRLPLFISGVLLLIACSCKETNGPGALQNNSWRVKSIEGSNYLSVATEVYVLTLGADGSFEIGFEVNECTGSWIAGPGKALDFGAPGCSKACCDSPYADNIKRILDVVDSYQLHSGKLDLLAGDEQIHLTLVR
jgi:META domain